MRAAGGIPHETQLTQAAIASKGIVRATIIPLVGDARGMEAQPLILPQVNTARGVRDVLVLPSMANVVRGVDGMTDRASGRLRSVCRSPDRPRSI